MRVISISRSTGLTESLLSPDKANGLMTQAVTVHYMKEMPKRDAQKRCPKTKPAELAVPATILYMAPATFL